MNPFRASPAIALFLIAAAGGGAAETPARQGLVTNSPFGQPAVAPAAAEAGLEFRGVVEEDGVTLVNLYDPTTRRSSWVPVQGKANGLEVKSYDAPAGKVAVIQGGRAQTLSLKHGNVLLAKPAPAAVESRKEGGEAASDSGKDAARETPAAFRNLTPEAQAAVDEFRRRRAERAAPAQPAPAAKKN